MIYVSKVLVEKYSQISMLRWVTKQKVISVKGLKYSDAAEWRDMELFLIKNLPFKNEHLMYSSEKFDTVYFKLFEKI